MLSPQPVPAEASWLGAAWVRLGRWWPAKLVGITAGMTLFFLGYFWVLTNPHRPPFVMSVTLLDRWIGFQPWTLSLYLSLWFYVSLAPALIAVRRELAAYGGAAALLGVTGLAIFYLWPTTVPAPDLDWTNYPWVALLKAKDASGNACPSLHVAFAVFSAGWLSRLLRQMGAGAVARGANWLWCGGILFSTVAIRQHVVLDVVAGAALSVAVLLIQRRWLVDR